MPEYRRFIAYFYEYIDGKKQKNAGFAKVELAKRNVAHSVSAEYGDRTIAAGAGLWICA